MCRESVEEGLALEGGKGKVERVESRVLEVRTVCMLEAGYGLQSRSVALEKKM